MIETSILYLMHNRKLVDENVKLHFNQIHFVMPNISAIVIMMTKQLSLLWKDWLELKSDKPKVLLNI